MASAAASRRRRPREPQRRDRRRPGADGRQLALDRRHGHRRQRPAATRLVAPVRCHTSDRRSTSASTCPTGCAPSARAPARCPRSTSDQLVDRELGPSPRARSRCRTSPPTRGTGGSSPRTGGSTPTRSCSDYTPRSGSGSCTRPATKVRAGGMNTTYEGLVVKVKRLFLDKETESSQAHVKAFVERVATFTSCPAVRWVAARRARADGDGRRARPCPRRCAMQISDLRGLGARAWSTHVRMPLPARPALVSLGRPAGLARRGRSRLPVARPRVGHPVRRRGAARQDGPAPRVAP